MDSLRHELRPEALFWTYLRWLAAQEIGDALQKIPEHKEKAKAGSDLRP